MYEGASRSSVLCVEVGRVLSILTSSLLIRSPAQAYLRINNERKLPTFKVPFSLLSLLVLS